jgi:hypothetical protein
VSRGVSLAGISDGQLLTAGEIRATALDDVAALEFVFTPEGRFAQAISLGIDYGKLEPSYGPECDPDPCQARVFSVPLRKLERLREGWGSLSARVVGGNEDVSARVYWDSTPPQAPFLSPRFNAAFDRRDDIQVIAHTLDEDITTLKVSWMLHAAGISLYRWTIRNPAAGVTIPLYN